MKPNQTLRYKPVKEGGLVNHFEFYLLYLGVTILCLFGAVACVVNAEAIDRVVSEFVKNLFL